MRKIHLVAGAVIAVLAVIAAWRLATARPAATVVTRDLQPFDRALAAFLKERAYDMRPEKLLELTVHENTAEAVYRLADAQGTYKLRVTWTVRFARKPDGGWRVTDYEKR